MTHVSPRSREALVARTTRVDTPAELLDHLGADGFAFLDGAHGFVTAGVAATVPLGEAPAFLQTIAHERDDDAPDRAGPRAVGALPFAADGQLTVPALVVGVDESGTAWRTRLTPSPSVSSLHVARAQPTRFTVESLSSASAWHDAVVVALDNIASGTLTKVVLARAVEIIADAPFDARTVLAYLRRAQPGCIVYADGGFVGASPELLVRKLGNAVTARPLAGTGRDPERLRVSGKDAREHHLVVDAVMDALSDTCTNVHADGPNVATFADIAHLATTVTASCDDANVSVTDVVRALHPTPAVGGTPRREALDLINRLEPHERGRYGGPCGWVDANGDGEFVVALRGAALDGTRARCFAGAGIVAGSDPEAEWAETQAKFEPMLRALVRP